MDNFLTWGSFIARKRRETRYTLRKIAVKIGISPAYLNEIENGKKINPSAEIMCRIINVLLLDEEEILLFYDLHAKANGIISQDITRYITENCIVRKALRTARNKSATEEDWQDFIDKLS